MDLTKFHAMISKATRVLGSKDPYFVAFGPKDHTIRAFWAILGRSVGVMAFQVKSEDEYFGVL